jgi:hypothetical protein
VTSNIIECVELKRILRRRGVGMQGWRNGGPRRIDGVTLKCDRYELLSVNSEDGQKWEPCKQIISLMSSLLESESVQDHLR